MPFATTLCINGVEVWDNRITQAYVDKFECEENRCDVQLMNCHCLPPIDPNTVIITDAPWWCAEDLNSEDFLGLYMIRAEGYDTRPWDRQTYDPYCTDGQTGGYVGPLRTKLRTMTFTVMGIGRTCAGAAYGKRWLLDRLQGDCSGGSPGNCPYEVQITDCCTSNTDGTPRTWQANDAGVMGPVEFENVCDCMVWRATFQIVMQPYFFDCQLLPSCDVVPAGCAGPACVPVDQWAARYDGLCGTICTQAQPGIPFPDSCEEVFFNQILSDCPSDPRATPCGVDFTQPDCLAVPGDNCSFSAPKPVSRPSKCDPCISANISDWGACCTIDTLAEEIIFDVTVTAGQWDVFGVNVAIFQSCPTNGADCVDPVWQLTVPRMNGGSTYFIDGISGQDVLDCSGNRSRGSRLGVGSSGATVLSCGTYYASVRYGCIDPALAQSPDFSVNIKPIIRRASL